MLEKRALSFGYAFRGLRIAWAEEANFKFHVISGVLALALGWFFGITATEWIFVVLCIGLVLAAETFNTALEELCDKFHADPDPHIAKIKDLAAGAVFLASMSAFIVGCVIFLPRILTLI